MSHPSDGAGKASMVLVRSNTGITGSNLVQDLNVCIFLCEV